MLLFERLNISVIKILTYLKEKSMLSSKIFYVFEIRAAKNEIRTIILLLLIAL